MTVNQNVNGNVGQLAGRDINNYSDGRQFSEQSDLDLAAMYNRAGQEIRQSGVRKNNYGVKLLLPTLAILGLCLLAYEVFDLSQSLLSFVVVLGSVYVIGKALRHHQREDERIGELNAIRKSIYQETVRREMIAAVTKPPKHD